jgi:hypothetical protein
MVAGKQKRERKGLGFQYPLQGHAPNDLTSFNCAPSSPKVSNSVIIWDQAFDNELLGNIEDPNQNTTTIIGSIKKDLPGLAQWFKQYSACLASMRP